MRISYQAIALLICCLAWSCMATDEATASDSSDEPVLVMPSTSNVGGYISAITFSKDASFYVVAESGGFTIKARAVESGRVKTAFEGYGEDNAVNSLVLSEAEKLVASAVFDQEKLRIHDLATGATVNELSLTRKGIFTLSNFFMEDTMIAAGCGDGSIVIWNIIKGEIVREFNFRSGPILSLAVDSDGSQMFFTHNVEKGFAVADIHLNDNSLVSTGTTFTKLNWDQPCESARGGRIFKNWFIIGCGDGSARLYDKDTRELKTQFVREIPGFTFGFNDNNIMAIGSFDSLAEVWDLKTLSKIDALPWMKLRQPILGLAITPDGNTVAIASKDVVRLWLRAPQKKSKSTECSADADSAQKC